MIIVKSLCGFSFNLMKNDKTKNKNDTQFYIKGLSSTCSKFPEMPLRNNDRLSNDRSYHFVYHKKKNIATGSPNKMLLVFFIRSFRSQKRPS